jgi:RNA polymerase sigma factor (sigma-70 family)
MSRHPGKQLLNYLQSVLHGADKEADDELLRRFVDGGDEMAFTTVVRRHGPMVLRLCRRMLRHPEDAEDAFQNTFLALARNASSVRRRQVLASYLYGVAYRIALKVRRRQGRQKAMPLPLGELPRMDTVEGDALHETRAVLDEEVMRLPDRLHRPVVLCYFQGLTQDQAAQKLGWSLNTCKRRLEEARQLLGERLGRRGVGLSLALLPMLLSEATVSQVPPALVAATVEAARRVATGLSVLGAMGLTHGVLPSGRAKLWSALIALVLVVSGAAGLAMVLIGQPNEPNAPPALAVDHPAPTPVGVVDDPLRPQLPVAGRVLDANGRPMPFAAVWALVRRPFRPGEQGLRDEIVAQGRADEHGEFRLDVPANFPTWFPERRVTLVARSTGQAPLTTVVRLAEHGTTRVDLRLTGVARTVRGRLLRPDGIPAPGVHLRVIRLGDVARERVQGSVEDDGRDLGWPGPVKTDADGRFALHGIDPEQGVWLQVEDDRYAPDAFGVRGEDGPEIRLKPAQVLEGRILAADTGKAVAGLKLTVRAAGQYLMPSRYTVPDYLSLSSRILPPGSLDGMTGADGRFRLRPPAGAKTVIEIHPPPDSPYLAVSKEVAWPDGVVQQTLAVSLPRGVMVRGRVVDDNDRPVAGASVQFNSPSCGNPAYQPDVIQARYRIIVADKEGRFRLAVPTGPVQLLAQGPTHEYQSRVMHTWGLLLIRPVCWGWHNLSPRERRAYTQAEEVFDLKATDIPREVQLRLVRGKTVTGRVVGPDGRSVKSAVLLSGEKVSALRNATALPLPVREGRYELPGCALEWVYPVVILDAENGWGATVDLKADGEGPDVQLAPCGSARVRLVDADGRPLAGIGPQLALLTERSFSANNPPSKRLADGHYGFCYDPQHYSEDHPVSDGDGWLTLRALIPGARYTLIYTDIHGAMQVVPDFRVEPGEQLHLPDLRTRANGQRLNVDRNGGVGS